MTPWYFGLLQNNVIVFSVVVPVQVNTVTLIASNEENQKRHASSVTLLVFYVFLSDSTVPGSTVVVVCS